MRRTLILGLLMLSSVPAKCQTLPTLPQAFVDVTLPVQGVSTCPTLTTGTNCIRNVPAGNMTSLQSAVNAATCGDTIVLPAGSTYSGRVAVPATSCSGWIEISSNAIGILPAPGNRAGPANVSNMATISSPDSAEAIRFLPSSNHWRLMGLELTTSFVSTVNTNFNIISMGFLSDGATPVTTLSQLPDSIVFDRVWIHGLPNSNSKRGITLNSQAVAVVDSSCTEIHSNGQDAQCLEGWTSAGPYLIRNNLLEASTENILFGGATPAINGIIPSDITITGNLIQKDVSWRNQAAPLNWSVKNLIEFKNGQRILIDGNVIQYSWAAGQIGFAFTLTPRAENNTCPWCLVSDVTITHNLIRHVSVGIEMAGGDGNSTPVGVNPTARVLLQNNVWDDISGVNWGGQGRFSMLLSSATANNPHDITIDHNTAFPDSVALLMGDSGQNGITALTNNLWNFGLYGVIGTGSSVGTASLNTYINPYTWADNTFINASGTPGATFPIGTFWNTQANVRFTNFTGGNFQLLNSSPYHNAGTDGKDIGVWDWTTLNSRIAGALSGTAPPIGTFPKSSISGVTFSPGVKIQ